MATRPTSSSSGSWRTASELLDRADPAFVDELRRIHHPDELGDFAATWSADPRPASRRFLFEYLSRPLNAPRHEALVKRLFKLAEAAEDDEVMAHFLVCFDRSLRRIVRTTRRWDSATGEIVEGSRAMAPSGFVMPRADYIDFNNLHEQSRQNFSRNRLYSMTTRAYLRRRAWRYFRQIGKTDSARYLTCARMILPLYTDEDTTDGLALIDNWGLIHMLFHHSDALIPNPAGWTLASGRSLREVTAAPYFPDVWRADPAPLLELLDTAQARTVRQWAIQMLRREHPTALSRVPMEKLVSWLGHPSPEMVQLAAELLRQGEGLAQVGTDRLLEMLHQAPSQTQELLCELFVSVLNPDEVGIHRAVSLARQRPQALARLGFDLLQRLTPRNGPECEALLQLAETDCDPLRAEMVRWSCDVISQSSEFRSEWVLEYLDSRHDEVRAEGWNWLQRDERTRDDVSIWQRLLESPYDDIRLQMVAYLEEQERKTPGLASPDGPFDPESIRLLWATVLLNVNRGAKNKPKVVAQLQNRLDRHPDEARSLVPILTVALRSLRGPEFRAGMVGVVNFLRKHPEATEVVAELIPELRVAPELLVS